MGGHFRRKGNRRWGWADQGPDPSASGSAAADGWRRTATRLRRRRTRSSCALADHASKTGPLVHYRRGGRFFQQSPKQQKL